MTIIPLTFFIPKERKSFLSISVNNLSKSLPGVDIDYAFICSSLILGHTIASSNPKSGFFEDVSGVRTNFYILANAPPRSYKSAVPTVLFNNLNITTLSIRSSVEGIARTLSEKQEAIIFADEFQDALRSKKKGGYTGDIIDLLKRGYYGTGMILARRSKEKEIEIKPGYALSVIATTTPDDIIVVADVLDSATLRRFLPVAPESKVPFLPIRQEAEIKWDLPKAYLKAVKKWTWNFRLTDDAIKFLTKDVYEIINKIAGETGISPNNSWLLNVGEYILKIAAVVAVDYILEAAFNNINDAFYTSPEHLGDIIGQQINSMVDGVDDTDGTTVQIHTPNSINKINNINNMNSKLADTLISISESILLKAVDGCCTLSSTANYDVNFDTINVWLNEFLIKLSAAYVFYLYSKAASEIEDVLGIDPVWMKIHRVIKRAVGEDGEITLRKLSQMVRMRYTRLKDYLLAMQTAGIIEIEFSEEQAEKGIDPLLDGSTIIRVVNAK